MIMKIGPDGIKVLHYFETCKLVAYPDPGSKDGSPWTIFWGHTGPEVKKGMTGTQAQADAVLLQDIARFEAGVLSLITRTPTQRQFDSLVTFSFNVGLDIDEDFIAEGLGDSTLLRKFNAGDTVGVGKEFPKWNKNDGKVMRGLIRRRYVETLIFLGSSFEDALKSMLKNKI